MELKKYYTFLAAVRSLSFSSAAEELFLTPSAVSKHIASLEEELSVQLFTRTSSGIKLTELGACCLPYVASIIETYKHMTHDLESRALPKSLSICSIPLQVVMGLPDLLSRFTELNKDIDLVLGECHGQEIENSLCSGRYELAFAANRYLSRERLDWELLYQEEVMAVLPLDHPLAGRSSIAISELSEERFIFMQPVTGAHGANVAMCKEAGFQPNVFMTTEREENMLQYVAHGMGVTFTTPKIKNSVPVENVCMVPLEERIKSGTVLVWKKGRKLSSCAQLFRDFVLESYKTSCTDEGDTQSKDV